MDSRELKNWLTAQGAAVAGVANLAEMAGYPTIPENLLDGFKRGVSFGIPIPKGSLADVKDRSTPLYLHAYDTVNSLLELIAAVEALAFLANPKASADLLGGVSVLSSSGGAGAGR